MSLTRDISDGMFFLLRCSLRVWITYSASLWSPIHFPLTKILVFWGTSLGSTDSRFCTSSWLIKKFSIYLLSLPTETVEIKDMFFTSPQDCPSGVSAGHMIPQWVLCRCLGFESFPDLLKGVLILLRWERVDMKVIRERAWDTPCLIMSPLGLTPQLPVAKACRNEWVMISELINEYMETLTMFFSMLRCSSSFSSFVNFTNYCLKS